MEHLRSIIKELQVVSKDETGSKRAIQELVSALEGEDGEQACRNLLQCSPKLEELFALWDKGVLKNATHQYVETFCLALRHVLTLSNACRNNRTDEETFVCDLGAQLITPSRIKTFYALLSSGNRTKVSSSLLLLDQVAESCKYGVYDILKTFDFSLSSLKAASAPPKLAGGKMGHAQGDKKSFEYVEALWTSNDLSRRPTRLAFLKLFMSLLRNSGDYTLPRLLQLKPVFAYALQYMSKDPQWVQYELVLCLQDSLLKQHKNIVNPGMRYAVFTEKALSEFSIVVQQATHGDNEMLAETAARVIQVILLDGIDQPDHGFRALIRRRNARFLSKIRPWESSHFMHIIQETTMHDHLLIPLYLKEMKYDFEPKESPEWVTMTGVLSMLLKPLHQKGLNYLKKNIFDLEILSELLNAIGSIRFCLRKSSMSKGLQHSSMLVECIVANLLSCILIALEPIIRVLEKLKTQNVLQKRRKSLEGSISKAMASLKSIMPDLQTAVTFHGKIFGAQANTGAIQKQWSIQLLTSWFKMYPEDFIESNIHREKFVYDRDALLDPSVRQQYINFITTDHYHHLLSSESTSYKIDDSSQFSHIPACLSQVLCLAASRDLKPDQVAKIKRWTLQQMHTTAIFDSFPAEASCWVDSIPREGDYEFVSNFFVDALKTVVKNPLPFYSIIDQYQVKSNGPSSSREHISPLHICVAQRLYRVLKSTKREASEKRSLLLFFMASFIRAICLIRDPLECVNLLFDILLSSEQGSSADVCGSGKRRAHSEGLNSECWGLDGADIDVFNAFSRSLVNLSGISTPLKKRGIERLINKPDGKIMDVLTVAMHPVLSYFPQEASRDITILHEIGSLKRLLLHQDIQCTVENVSDSIKAITVLAEGCARILDVIAEQFLGIASEPLWRSIFENLSTHSFEMTLMLLKSIMGLLSANFEKHVPYQLSQLPVIKMCKLANGTQEYFRDEVEYTTRLRLCDLLYDFLGVEHKNGVQMLLDQYLERVKSFPEYKLQHVLNLCKKVLSESLPGTHSIASKIVEIWNSQIDSKEDYGDPGWHLDFLLAKMYSDMNFQRLCEDLPTGVSDKLLSKLFEISDISSCSYISSIITNGYGREKSMILLLQSMEKAKLEDNLYKRRLSLFKMCTIANALLQRSDPNSSQDVQSLKEALYGPLLSFFTSSKKIYSEDGPRKHLEFSIGHYGLLLLQEFLKLDSSDTISILIVEKLIIQIDQGNSGSIVKPVDHLAPSAVDKLHCACLLVKKACAVEHDPVIRLKWEYIACRCSIVAIRMLSAAFKMKGDASFCAQEALNKILSHELGDCIAELSNSSREAPFFQEMLFCVHSEWLHVLITSENYNPVFWTSLRRFEASLLPEEDSVIFSKDATVLVNLYGSTSHAFLDLITSDFMLDALRNIENCPPPLSVNAAKVSLPLTSVLSYHTSVPLEYDSTLSKGIGNNSEVKLQICELVETYNDFMVVLEENMKDIGQEHLVAEPKSSVLNGIQALIPYLMASYGASLSSTDVAMWSLLRSLNKRVCTVKDKRLNGNELEQSLWALFHGPLSLHRFTWGSAALQLSSRGSIKFSELGFEARRSAVSTFHFPEWRTLISDDRLSDNISNDSSEVPPEYLLPVDPAGYDPSFILATSLHWLTTASIKPIQVVEAGVLPLMLRSLGSSDPSMRMISLECLHFFEIGINSWNHNQQTDIPADHIRFSCKEMKQLRFLLSWVRNSITRPGLEKLTAVHALFVAEASVALLSPGSPSYSIIYKFMLRSPFMDQTQLPLRRQILVSAIYEERFLRAWYFMLLLGGLRSSQDVSIYEKMHIFEIIMHTIDFTPETGNVSDLEFGILYRACQIPKSARLLAHSGGAMGWFARRMLCEIYQSLNNTSVIGHGPLDYLSAWQTLCSWKGVTKRGSDRDRRQVLRDSQSSVRILRLAEAMIKRNLKISDATWEQIDEAISHLESTLLTSS
eukprot:jgi/Picsp_1/3441/NSC_06279-R1_urb1 ribosome biogenesis 1 homolog